jgi:hypothetical protein
MEQNMENIAKVTPEKLARLGLESRQETASRVR